MGRSWKRAQPQGPAPRQFLTRQSAIRRICCLECVRALRSACLRAFKGSISGRQGSWWSCSLRDAEVGLARVARIWIVLQKKRRAAKGSRRKDFGRQQIVGREVLKSANKKVPWTFPSTDCDIKSVLTRISHTAECIGAANQRKPLCCNHFRRLAESPDADRASPGFVWICTR